MESKLKKLHNPDIWFGILFILVGIFLFWKCRYGYVNMDEAFYLTVPYRLFQGDALFLDEWAPSQMSGFITYPFVATFIKFTGGTTGIYLYIRYLYVVCKLLITAYMYHTLKKVDYCGGAFTAIVFMVFADYGMHVLSYNSLAIGGLIMCLLLLWDCEKNINIKCILAGISLSVAVLAMPSLALLYILYGIAVLISCIMKRKKLKNIPVILTGRVFAFLSLGIGLMLICFFGFVFTRISLEQLIESIPNLMSDPEHVAKKAGEIIRGYLARIAVGNHRNWYTFIIYSLFTGVFLWVLITFRKRRDQKEHQYMVVILLTLILLAAYYLTNEYINHTIFVMNVPAVFFPFISRSRKVLDVFHFLYLPGMVYTFLEYLVSNTGFSGISGASCVATMGSALMLVMVGREFSTVQNSSMRKINQIITNILIIMFSVILLYQRYNYVFWERPVSEQTQFLVKGPQAGLIVSENWEKEYLAEMEDLDIILGRTDGKYFLNLHDESLYLATDMRYAIYSAHPFGIRKDRDILFRYYEIHPDKVPDAAYLYFEMEEIAGELCERLDMEKFGGKEGIILIKR